MRNHSAPGRTAAGIPALAAAAAAAVLAAVACAVGLPTAPAQAAAADGEVTVSVAPRGNGIVADGDDLRVTVRIHNGTDSDLAAGSAQLFLDRATFSSRSQIESWFDRSPTDTTDALGSFLAATALPAVAAGATSKSVTVDVPSESLSLSGYDWGAKAFGVRYSVAGAPVSEAHSSVVYHPSDSAQATRLAMAVPLTVPESTSGLVAAEALATYTSANGVLTRELDAVRGTDVAIGIDPMILASIRILGNTAPPSAIDWLHRLESASNETFALAYADSDVSAMRQAGAAGILAPIDFSDAIAAQQEADPDSYTATADGDEPQPTGTPGSDPTSDAVPTATPTSIPPTSEVPTSESLVSFDYTVQNLAWPVEGTVAADDLAAFATSGVTTTLLSSTNVTQTDDSTENAATTVSSRKTLVSDATLSGLVRDASSAGTIDEWRSDIAQLSAELATLTHERPSDARTLLTTLGRDWATTGSRLDQTVAALSTMAWVDPVSLTAARQSTATTAALVPKKAAASRISALAPLVAADDDLRDFATALKKPALATAKERLRVLALSSTAWGDNPSGLTTEVAKARAQVDKIIGQVAIVQGSSISILGDRSSLPVYVRNDTRSVAVVSLRVQPSNYYLSIEKNDVQVTIQPDSQTRVTVPVQSVANGNVMLRLELSSKTGVAVSTPSEVAITVRAGWENVITAVFAAAVVLLFGGGIFRSIRRRRRNAGGDDAENDPGPAEPREA